MAQVVYKTRVTNLTSSAQVLPAPYGSTVPARGSVVVNDPVSVVVANLAKLPSWQLPFWQVSVAESSSASTALATPLNLNGQRAVNAANPVDAQDLTTKSYVDSLMSDGVTLSGDVKGNCSEAEVVALRCRPLADVAPVPGQLLGWNGSAWAPINGSGGGGGSASTQVVATPVAVTVGDCVKLTINGAIKVNPYDPNAMPAMGVVVSVLDAASATVQFGGETPAVLSGLVVGVPYFVSNTGRLSATMPTGAALVQPMGLATSTSQLLVMPSLSLIQRSL